MITAVDTNILLDVFQGNPPYAAQSRDWIDTARIRGDVIICAAVYAELVPSFNSKDDLARTTWTKL